MKKIVCCILIAVLGLCCAQAEGSDWTCASCGQTGNTGNFCFNCGAARPAESWTCASCGKTDNTGNYCSNCGAARSVQGTVNPCLEQIPGEANRVKVLIADVSASSYLQKASDPLIWQPANAADGDESTCWQFSSKAKGTLGNTWLALDIGSAQTVDALWFKNGFWAYSTSGSDQYVINARPKGIRAEFLYNGSASYADPVELTLQDDKARTGWQRFDVGHHENVIGVRLWVLSSYKGSKYENDVCLSEVMLVQNAPAATALQPQATNVPTVYGSSSNAASAKLKMRLSTRSGPGTQYSETGSYFNDNWQTVTVQVLAKEWDSYNDIWWVLVDFTAEGARHRVWTGQKRVDVNVDSLREYYSSGQGTVSATDTRQGPGSNYAKGPRITHWEDVVAYGRENGYVEVEYYSDDYNTVYRAWVPEGVASID